MYQIVHRNNCWHILKGTSVVLFGIGSIQTAISIAQLHGILLTFENYELERVA